MVVLGAAALVTLRLMNARRSASAGAPHSFAPLRPIANVCTAGSCPTIYVSDTGRLVVQGYTVTAVQAGVDVPDGEALVEVPLDLLKEALQKLP